MNLRACAPSLPHTPDHPDFFEPADLFFCKSFSEGALTKEQKEKLLSIGLTIGVSQAEISWREQYGQAEEFFKKFGNLSVPKRYTAGLSQTMPIFVSLSTWMAFTISAETLFAFLHFEEFFKKFGNLSVPKRYTAGNGKKLGVWLQHQRAGRRNGALASWQVGLLDGIGMVWECKDAWERGFLHAQEYALKKGDLEVPNAHVCADGFFFLFLCQRPFPFLAKFTLLFPYPTPKPDPIHHIVRRDLQVAMPFIVFLCQRIPPFPRVTTFPDHADFRQPLHMDGLYHICGNTDKAA